jgi:hypothetical protein
LVRSVYTMAVRPSEPSTLTNSSRSTIVRCW